LLGKRCGSLGRDQHATNEVLSRPPSAPRQPRLPSHPFFRLVCRHGAFHRLENFEALEFGMAEIEWLVGTGSVVRTAERFRPSPRLEVGPAMPDRVRRIEDVILPVWATQKVKGDEARDVAQMCVCDPGTTLKRFIAMNITLPMGWANG